MDLNESRAQTVAAQSDWELKTHTWFSAKICRKDIQSST